MVLHQGLAKRLLQGRGPPDRPLRLCGHLVKLSCFHWPQASYDQTLIMVSRDFSKYQNTHSQAWGKPVHFLLFSVNALACRAPGTWLQWSPEGFLRVASTLTLSPTGPRGEQGLAGESFISSSSSISEVLSARECPGQVRGRGWGKWQRGQDTGLWQLHQ